MKRFDSIPRLDDLLFVVALVTTATFAAYRFLEQEHEKTVLALAKQNPSAIAQIAQPCRQGAFQPNRLPSTSEARQARCDLAKASRRGEHAPF